MNIPYTLGQEVSFIMHDDERVEGQIVRIINQLAFGRVELWIKRQNKPIYIATLLCANNHEIEIA